MLRTPYRRSALRRNYLVCEPLECRLTPAAFFIDDDFNAGNTGADWQVTKFANLTTAFADDVPPTDTDTVSIAAGDYSPDALTTSKNIGFTVDGAAIVGALNLSGTTSTLALNADLTLGSAAASSLGVVVSGTGALIKQGSGTLTLSKANTYSGSTTINEGILAISNATALGTTAAGTTVADGATLSLSGGLTVAEPLTITGNGVGSVGALQSAAGTNKWSGAIAIGTGGARIQSDSAFTVSGALGTTGNIQPITVAGSAAMTISGLINSGTTGIGTDGQFNFIGGNNVTVTGANGTTFTSPILINNNTVVSYSVTAPLGKYGLITLDTGTLEQLSQTFAVEFISSTRNIELLAGGGTLKYINPTTPSGTANISIVQNITTAPTSATVISGVGELRFQGPGGVIALGKTATYTGPTRVMSGGYARTRNFSPVFPTGNILIVESGGRFDYSSTGLIQTFTGLQGAGEVAFNALTTGARLIIDSPIATTNTFTGVISTSGTGTGGFTMKGSGTQILSGASTYAGTTTVTNGTLVAGNSSGSAFGTGAVTVNGGVLASVSGSTVSGFTGSLVVSGSASTGGTVAPGTLSGTGILKSGSLNLTATTNAATYHVNIAGLTPGSGYDQHQVTGTVNLGGGNAILVIDDTGFDPAIGTNFTIIANDGTDTIGTTFAGVANNGTILSTSGKTYRVSYSGGIGGSDVNDVVLTRVNPSTVRYVSPTFTGVSIGDSVGDGDLATPEIEEGFWQQTAFSTIQSAINASVVGDTIIVNGGTYAEAPALNNLFNVVIKHQDVTVLGLDGSGTDAKFAAITVTGVSLVFSDTASHAYAGSITGTGGIRKDGTGVQTLGVSTTYSGATDILAGTLRASTTTSFSGLSLVNMSSNTALQLGGFSNTILNITNFDNTAVLENAGTTAAVLSIGNNNGDVNFSGIMRDGTPPSGTAASFGFRKIGNGVLTIPDNYAYTGLFTLGGGSYTVASIPAATLTTGGVPSPFGASPTATALLSLGGGGRLIYTGTSFTTPRNINLTTTPTTGTGMAWEITDANTTVTIGGTITNTSGSATIFIKDGDGDMVFTHADAFQTPNTYTGTNTGTYGTITTGDIDIRKGDLTVNALRLNGNSRATTTLLRKVLIAGGSTLTTTGPLLIDAASTSAVGYFKAVDGLGTLLIRNATASTAYSVTTAPNPSIGYDVGPTGGDGGPFGAFINTPIDFGNIAAVIMGKANRNGVHRYSGDLRFDGPITGTAAMTFIGTKSVADSTASFGKHDFSIALAGDNVNYTGAITISNSILNLVNTTALTAANSVTFNNINLVDGTAAATTNNRSGIYLWGRDVTIGSLNDTNAVGTSFIRNGALDTTNGGTNVVGGSTLSSRIFGSPSEATLTIVQAVDGAFAGSIDNGPNDRGTAGDPLTSTYKALNIIKQGSATLTLTGTANTLTGTTRIQDGTLAVNGSLSTSAVTAETGGTLGGIGTVAAPTIQGTVTGGTATTPGILNTTGAVTVPGTLRVNITGATVGTGFDQLGVAGTIDVTGGTLTVVSSFTPTTPDPLIIINNTGTGPIVGEFANAADGAILNINGTNYVVDYQGGVGGNDLTLTPQVAAGLPAVTGISINNGDAQRSRVTKVSVSFAGTVNPGQFNTTGAIRLTVHSSSGTGLIGAVVQTVAPLNSGLINVAQGVNSNTIDLTFSTTNANLSPFIDGVVEYGSLGDGSWKLEIPFANNGAGYTNITDTPFSNTAPIKRLFGDWSGDGTVDGGTDFSNFSLGNLTAINAPFDFNADGTIDGGTDFAEFGERFGKTV